MFVRGGVYVVVRGSMGPVMARLSVSALVFDYILTGPISSVSAGQYLGRLLNELSEMLHSDLRLNPNYFAAVFGVVVTLYFWRSNVRGIHESSGKALRIMQVNTIMVALLFLWCPISILLQHKFRLPPGPTLANLSFSKEALGWLAGTRHKRYGVTEFHPLKPLDNQQFMAQIAQFTTLQQTQMTNAYISQLITNQAALQSQSIEQLLGNINAVPEGALLSANLRQFSVRSP